MSGLYKEANYENSIVELFRNMGYRHVYGPKIERDFYSPLYDEELIAALYRLNPSMPEAAIQDALYKLKNFENAELVQKNELFMNYLQNGIEVSISLMMKNVLVLFIYLITKSLITIPL